jgi:hypothetical protein
VEIRFHSPQIHSRFEKWHSGFSAARYLFYYVYSTRS